ncbi:NC domain-containing protein-like protein [Perilla frutescens var. frutescens]|nr:NC domain-containing protein-like protein [Perilla frutescens var. frutescens]
MGILSHKVKRSELEAGDHIYTWSAGFVYSHHGIYIGGDKVVHFTQDQSLSSGSFSSMCFFSSDIASVCLDFPDCGFRKHRSGVVMSCLNCFLGSGSLYRFEYGVSREAFIAKLRGGTCTTAKSDPPEAVIHRAMYLLHNGFGNYDLLTNNCEDLALYCRTGLVICGRKASGGSGQASSAVSVPVAAVLSFPLGIFVSSPVLIGATAVVNYTLNRYATDVGVRDDVVKVKVEDMAAYHGYLPAEEGACGDDVDIGEVRPTKRRRTGEQIGDG